MKAVCLLSVILSLLISLTACLEPGRRPYYEGIDISTRLDNQQARIDQGISSGELTRAEADMVQDNLNWIKQEYSRARDDGKISGEEWNRIERYLDQNSAMITDKKHNPVKRLFAEPYQRPKNVEIAAQIREQQERIDKGIASGELTLREAEIVQNNLNWIKTRYTNLRSDGKLTSKEEVEINQYLDRNSEMIYNKKHNPVQRIY